MMTNTGREHNITGKAVRGDSYYGHTDGVHTVQVFFTNFTGRFGIQGTLVTEPQDGDWFDINLNTSLSVNNTTPYAQFPINPLAPTGRDGDTGTLAFTFVGNFTFLRAIVDRSYIPEPAENDSTTGLGHIDKVLLAM
jgi:hypothetical protein